jgi:hypothetical protein
MTTSHEANVHAIAIEGNFDDCQALVKAMFNDHAFRDKVKLSGVNSINWGRIMAQIVYYFAAASRLGAPERPVSFTVPTGNFGDIFAGYAAKRMGLPIAGWSSPPTATTSWRARSSGRYESPASRHFLAIDGHPGVVQFRAAALRGVRPRRDIRHAADGRAFAIGRLHASRRSSFEDRGRIRGGGGQRSRNRIGHGCDAEGRRLQGRSAYGGRGPRRSATPRGRTHDYPCDSASGEVSRCGRGGLRRTSGAARSSAR